MTRKKKISKESVFDVYTDGGCLFNPGGPGACAAVIIDKKADGIRKPKTVCEGFRSTTNNRMEILAAIIGLNEISKGSKVILYSDSQYMINCFTGFWARHKNEELFKDLDKAAKGLDIECRWVPGHSGNVYNEMCDQLCSKKMRQKNLKIDNGYEYPAAKGGVKPEIAPKKPALTEAMDTNINVPDSFPSQIEIMDPDEYAIKYKVNTECARAIQEFAHKGTQRFKDYVKLVTGGRDYWSTFYKEDMICNDIDAHNAYDVIKTYIKEDYLCTFALRWYCRGLPLKHCIRKVLVDNELSSNINGKVNVSYKNAQ